MAQARNQQEAKRLRGHAFLTKAIESKLIDYDEYAGPYPKVTPDTKVYFRLFGGGAGQYLITHYDRKHEIFWGYCDIFGTGGSWGPVYRADLELTLSPRGIPPMAFERDCWFTPRSVKEISEHAASRLVS